MISPIAFAAGAATWSAAEYFIHRFVGHGKRRRRPEGRFDPAFAFQDEHLRHHVDPTYFAATITKVRAAAAVIGAGSVLTSFVVGPRLGLSYSLGFGLTYGAYEVAHRRIHTHGPRGAYGRWMRRNHLHHHYGSSKSNHGVTSPLWDYVFGTHVEPGRVKVPDVRAPHWMLTKEGTLRPELAGDYELVKKAKKPAMKPRRATKRDRSQKEAA